ncbi:MAG: 3-hydroxyacyl-CoA dehydrogenase family protein, partial [Firmicutes bacterium]|nr:3-hydroxyacyl-CoA dehydrogenase family protein [Bacillota bacterium]
MTYRGIQKICVVGAGNIGHQITLCAALAGYMVKCTDIDPGILQKAEQFADTYLFERVAKGKLSEEVARRVRANLLFTTNLEEAAGDADFVIEAILEKLDLKRQLFARLDKIA